MLYWPNSAARKGTLCWGAACTKGNKTIIMIGGLQHCSRQLTKKRERKRKKKSEKVPSIRKEKRDLGRLETTFSFFCLGCFLFFVLLLLPTTSLQLEFLKKKKKNEKEGKNREREKTNKKRWAKRKREVRIQNAAYQWMTCFFFTPTH